MQWRPFVVAGLVVVGVLALTEFAVKLALGLEHASRGAPSSWNVVTETVVAALAFAAAAALAVWKPEAH